MSRYLCPASVFRQDGTLRKPSAYRNKVGQPPCCVLPPYRMTDGTNVSKKQIAANVLNKKNRNFMATPQKPEAGTPAEPEKPKADTPCSQPSAPAEKKARKDVYYRRATCARQLCKEINRWRKLKISESLCLKLVQIYLGDPEFLDINGVYPLSQLAQLASKYYSKHSTLLVNLLGQSGSFRFLCNTEKTVCYGFYSTWRADEHVLENYQPETGEFNRLDVQPDGSSDVAPVAHRASPPFNYYCILSNININTMQIPTPPSEGTRLPGSCARVGGFSGSNRRDLTQPQAPAKPNYGSAADFFHQLNSTEHGRNTVLEPLRQRIMKRFHLDRTEAGFVLIQVVKSFLIPLFDHHAEFPARPYGGRVAWLKNILQKQYFATELEHAFQDVQGTLQQYRSTQQQARHNALTAFRPLSPYEWSHEQTGQRYYRDPDDGVIDLPPEAPARPSATARWNPYTHQWCDEETGTVGEETEVDYEAVFGNEDEDGNGSEDANEDGNGSEDANEDGNGSGADYEDETDFGWEAGGKGAEA